MKLTAATCLALCLLGLAAWLWQGSDAPKAVAPAPEVLVESDPAQSAELESVDVLGDGNLARLDLGAGPAAAATEPETQDSLPPEPQASSLSVQVTWRDGEPAADVSLLLMSFAPRGYRQRDRWEATDADGAVTFEQLEPGKYAIEAERGGKLKFELTAGEDKSEKLVLDGAYDVHGTVHDAESRPIAGAQIVAASLRYDWRGAKRVATSDENGEFTIRCLEDGLSLGAFASGWAPSKLFDLSIVDPNAVGADHLVEVELVLTDPGADIWGTVTSPDGDPLAGVHVALGRSDIFQEYAGNDHFTEKPKPHVVETDKEGRYRIEGAAEGSHPLSAWTPGWPIWRTEIEVLPGTDQRHDIAFAHGVTVSGVVSLSTGEPAKGAAVLVLEDPFEDSFPSQGPYEAGSPFAHPRTEADGEGRFRLGPVTPGELHMYASLGAQALTEWTGEEPTYEGMFQETLLGAPGMSVVWNPTLSLGLVVRGKATFADGRPMKNIFITATDLAGEGFSATTDEDGVFAISDLKKEPHRMTLQMPHRAPRRASVPAFYDVMPPADDLHFVADYSPAPKVAKGTLRMRIRDTARLGDALGTGAIRPTVHSIDDLSFRLLSADKEGIFEAELVPGPYRILLGSGEQVVQRLEPIEIRSGETLDLGTIETVPLGSFEVSVARPKGFIAPVVVRPKSYYLSKQTIPEGSNSTTFANMCTGPLTLELSGEGVATEQVQVQVGPDTTQPVQVDLRAAATVHIECTLKQPEGYRGMTLAIKDENGTTWLDQWRRESRIREWPHRIELQLPTGSYSVSVETSDGQSGAATFTVESTGASQTAAVRAR